MKGIGFYNMKVFKESQWFDFEKLTLLTGTNNSGKSSVINGMQMLQESIAGENLQEFLGTKFKVSSNQNKHGSIFNFIHKNPKKNLENKFIFYLKKKNVKYSIHVDIKNGLESYGVIEKFIARDSTTDKLMFTTTLINNNNENKPEYQFQVNFKYFVDKFNKKCENTIKLKKSNELDKLTKLVNAGKRDIKELLDLTNKLSKKFSVYISVEKWDELPAITSEGKTKTYKNIVQYGIRKNDINFESTQQKVDELGVFFYEQRGLFYEPGLLGYEDLKTMYTDTTKKGIFDFSMLWRDHLEFKLKFKKLLLGYYNTDYEEAYKLLCDDLIILLSNIKWQMGSYDPNHEEWVPYPVHSSFKSIPWFGLPAFLINYHQEVKSYTNKGYVNALATIDYEHENVIKLKKANFFQGILEGLSHLFNELINKNEPLITQNVTEDMTIDERINRKIYSFYMDENPLVYDDAYNLIKDDIDDKIFDVNLKLNNLYISSNRTNIVRSYNFNDRSDFSKLLQKVESLQSDEKEMYTMFINKWIKLFGIADELVLKPDSDTGNFKAFLKKNDNEISLTDYGLGTNQLLPVIFALGINTKNPNWEYSLAGHRYHNKTIVLEEPEANLHPALQSKLADMFVDAIQKFNVQIIAETHSEYLIRKLQYLSAKYYLNKKDELRINPKDIAIYYFNSDQYVSNKEPKVKRLDIDNFGGLSDTFGEGFFDEATNLKFQLMKLNQSQSN